MGSSASNAVHPVSDSPQARLVTENDLIWPGKKKLIRDLNVFREIDKRAIDAPDNLRSRPADLVAYLIAPCKTELEKYRAIFRWIASHIDYDVEFLDTGRQGKNAAENCMVSGKAVSIGYCNVLEELCSHAGIKTETVSGCAKGGEYRVGDKDQFGINNDLPTKADHDWVIVRIKGKQFLCDPMWAAGKTEKKNGKSVYNREWEEGFFLSNPEAFFETHWPMGKDNESLPDKQLLRSASNNFTDWLERPHKKMAASYLGVTLTSHKDGLIKTQENEVDIEFTSKYELQPFVNMETLKDSAWNEIEGMTLVYRVGKKYKVRVRLPFGNVPFVVKILGKLTEAEDEVEERSLFIASYRIICTGEGQNKAYHPEFCERAGIEPDAAKLGFKLESHKSPLIFSKGKALVAISTPNSDPISQTTHLYRLRDNGLLEGQVYVERNKNKLVCHVRMYEQGEYALILFGDLLQEDGSTLPKLGSFLINCTSALPNELPHYSNSFNINGPKKNFLSLGLKDLSGDSSIKKAGRGGQCSIKFSVPLDEVFWPILFDCEGNQLPPGHCAGVLEDNTLTLLLKLPKPGYFTVGLIHGTDRTSLDCIALYMIENDEPFQGELFPELSEMIGPLPIAAVAGLIPLYPKMDYYVKTSDPCHTVSFVPIYNLDTFGVLTSNGNEVTQFLPCNQRYYGSGPALPVLTYQVKLPSAGIYSFGIWLNRSPNAVRLVSMLIEYVRK